MTDEEYSHLREMLSIYQDRRRIAEEQMARYARGRVPSDLKLEYQEIEESIARIDAKLRLPSIPQEVQDATGSEAAIVVLRQSVNEMNNKIVESYRWMNHQILEMREETRIWRTSEKEARASGQAFYRLAILILAAGVALALLLIAAIIGGKFL